MKTKILKHRAPKRILIGVLLVLFCFTSKAQIWENVHFNVDWQMNMPLNSNFADKFSGWGMNFEGKYDLTPYWSIGAFLNFHTNHRYVDRQTTPLPPTASLTTDQQQSAFQLPFGISVSYKLLDNRYVRPYFGVKSGAMYSQNSIYNNLVQWYERPWGFYVSPELGIDIHPVPYQRLGFHVAVYYSYATNQTDILTYSEDGRNSMGVRVGVCF